MRKLAFAALAITAFIATQASPAKAQTTAVYCGPSAGMGCETGNEQMIFLQKADGVTQGFGNIGSQTGTPVMTITSIGGMLNMFIDLANGFATITPAQPATTYNGLTFSVPGFQFTDLIFDAQLTGTTFVTSCTAPGGCTPTNTFTNMPNQDAEYSITASKGTFSSVTIDATASGGFEETKHFEISGLCQIMANGTCEPVSVPEPASLVMLGFGLLGLAGFYRRRV